MMQSQETNKNDGGWNSPAIQITLPPRPKKMPKALSVHDFPLENSIAEKENAMMRHALQLIKTSYRMDVAYRIASETLENLVRK